MKWIWALAVVALGLALVAASALQSSPLVWDADFEEGDLSELTGEYNSGDAETVASQEQPHNGAWSAKQTVDTSGGSAGTRLARLSEIRRRQGGIYGAWFYFPQPLESLSWYQLFQFKARTCESCGSEVTWALYIVIRDGAMRLRLRDKTADPTPPRKGVVTYEQTLKKLPVGRWTHIEVRYVPAVEPIGRITVWQDETQLWDLQNVRTTWACSDCEETQVPGKPSWLVNAYGESLSPSRYVQYVDDMTIR
jgi:hypothetical protein